MNKFLGGLCVFFASFALLFGYWAEGSRMKELSEAKSAPSIEFVPMNSATIEKAETLPPMAARGVQQFLEVAANPLPPASTATAELYENPDGDGAAYQDDVIPYVYDMSPSYVLLDDVPSDYPSP